MKEDLGIFITSANRARLLITPYNMSDAAQAMTTFVVPQAQYEEYVDALARTKCAVLAAPEGIDLMSPKRQWIIENANTRYFWMMDDDLTFYVRQNMKLIKATPLDLDIIINEMHVALSVDQVPFVGISSRYGNNQVEEDFKEVGRVSRSWAFDRELYMKLGINITPFPEYVIDDFHIILSFLEKGHKNRIYYKYSQSDKGSNSEGGCSAYRDFEVQRKSAMWLKSQHPRFVDVVEKKTKAAWPGMKKSADGSNVREDVRIHWKEAYQAGRSTNTGFRNFYLLLGKPRSK